MSEQQCKAKKGYQMMKIRSSIWVSILVVALGFGALVAEAGFAPSPIKTVAATPLATMGPVAVATIDTPAPTPTPSPRPKTLGATTVKKPDNTALCNKLIADERAILVPLQTQGNDQLALMKRIALGQSESSSLGGSTQDQIVRSSEGQQAINAAQASATALLAQYNTARDNYQNQLFANSCFAQLQAQVWPIQ